jgi:hypothetical protein
VLLVRRSVVSAHTARRSSTVTGSCGITVFAIFGLLQNEATVLYMQCGIIFHIVYFADSYRVMRHLSLSLQESNKNIQMYILMTVLFCTNMCFFQK